MPEPDVDVDEKPLIGAPRSFEVTAAAPYPSQIRYSQSRFRQTRILAQNHETSSTQTQTQNPSTQHSTGPHFAHHPPRGGERYSAERSTGQVGAVAVADDTYAAGDSGYFVAGGGDYTHKQPHVRKRKVLSASQLTVVMEDPWAAPTSE